MRLIVLSMAVALAGCASARVIVPPPQRIAAEGSPIATSVRVHAGSDLVYVSGTVPDVINPQAAAGSVARFGDTEAQTLSVLGKIQEALVQHGMGLGDIVMMRVFLVAPPGQQRMDFAGMMRAYRQRFGTPEQPNRPARSTMEVSGLVDPGWLVEIEATAARPAPKPEKVVLTGGQ